MSPRITQDGPGCLPTSNCNQFTGSLKATCEDLRKDFRSSKDKQKLISEGIIAKKTSYEICSELGKCPDQTKEEGADCAADFNKYECNDDIECKAAREHCDDKCFACYWQVRVWPTFQSECKRALFRRRRLLMDPGLARLDPGLGSPPMYPQPANDKSPDDLMQTCWETWDIFEKSAKARFLSGMVDQLGNLPWEANIVCKCLGICAYDEFEGIQLLSACDWHEDSPDITAALFPDISPALNAAIRDHKPLSNQILTSQDNKDSNRYWNGA